MIKLYRIQLKLIITTLLLLMSPGVASADVGPSDLEGEDMVMFQRFRELFQYGTSDEFYSFAKKYEQDLLKKGYMMLYYKLQNNEGFFALRHNQLFHAMQIAERLGNELHKNGATQYYYLATGLMGDIYYTCHNREKAEAYFIQALEEVGDSDPKFSMRCYHSLAEMLSIKDPVKALDWTEKALSLAKETNNMEYHSLSLAMKAYIYFMEGDKGNFNDLYTTYQEMRSRGLAEFSHRYDHFLDIAQLAFGAKYQEAFNTLKDGKTIYVDSSLVAVRIFAMEGDISRGFEAMKRRYLEMDSIYSVLQDANFDQMATEYALLKSKEEAMAKKRLAKRLSNWLVGLVVVFLFVYLMGRRRLMKKIWARNKELKVALSKASESDQMKTAFIRSMSHEIRTPLNAVAGFSQVLCSSDYVLSDKEKEDMQARISDNVRQITSIVNEVLELSRSESEGHTLDVDKKEVNCNELVRGVLEEMKGRQQTGVELRFATNVDDTFVIHTNYYRLKSALTHLMDNAVKFTEKGYVEMQCEKVDDQMRLMVTDTGVGIKAEDYERIFETFLKINDFKEGIGLGLPLCRRLIGSLGGEVELDKAYTAGCRFVITLSIK